MNLKTRKLLRTLVRQNPELMTADPQQILDQHYNRPKEEVIFIPVHLVEEEKIEKPIVQEKLDINSLDWNSILELAKTNNITNYRKMKKSDLTSTLLELQNDGQLLQSN